MASAVDGLKHRGFDFDEAAGFELRADGGDDFRARDEDVAHLGIRDEIEVTLAVARVSTSSRPWNFSGMAGGVFDRNSSFSTWRLSSPVRVRKR